MNSARLCGLSGLLCWFLCFEGGNLAGAQPLPAAPAPPAKYKVLLRYHIPAVRDQHVQHYDALVEYLKSLNFEFDPPLDKRSETDREDATKNLMAGLIAPVKLFDLFGNPSVAGLLIMPVDHVLPEQPEQPVLVRLELASGLAPDRQMVLTNQVRVLLEDMGFRETAGYDHRGYSKRPFSRLVGTMPAGRLDLLLRDLRDWPPGWLAPVVPRNDWPAPLRFLNPILFTEVVPDAEPPRMPAQAGVRGLDYLNKISPELWTLVNQKEQADREVRLEMFLAASVAEGDQAWRKELQQAAPDLLLEGYQGQLVAGLGRVGQVPALAALPQVSVIRLAPQARIQVRTTKASPDPAKALQESGLAVWHRQKKRGQGVRLAIIDTDFRGYRKLVQEKRLPPTTRLVDLTTLHTPAIFPLPTPGDPAQLGHGSQCALAAAQAAPAADLILVRIDGAGLLQLEQVVQYFRGNFFTEELERRQGEMRADAAVLQVQREQLQTERRLIMADFTDESEIIDFDFIGPAYGWLFSRRHWHQQRMAFQEAAENAHRQREARFRQLLTKLQSLQGNAVVACPLSWADGYAAGGTNALGRWFDNQGGPGFIWFQTVGHYRQQSWTGLFQDEDGNGAMEFASGRPGPQDRWTAELNFLGWQPFAAAQGPEMPAKARLRLSVQWREAHDPAYFFRPGYPDWYRQPLADLRLSLLRQRDPSGKTLPADIFEVAAQSAGWPQRLDNQPGGSTYEQTLEFTVAKPGRYAVRLDRPLPSRWVFTPVKGQLKLELQPGLVATGIRPRQAATLPSLEKHFELQPRLLVQVVDEPSSHQGRPIFLDWATDNGCIDLLAESRSLVSVGAADWEGRPRPFSSSGPPAFLDLAYRPTLLAFDAVGPEQPPNGAFGASLSTCFAAGMTASLLSSGITPAQLRATLQQQGGKLWRLPADP